MVERNREAELEELVPETMVSSHVALAFNCPEHVAEALAQHAAGDRKGDKPCIT